MLRRLLDLIIVLNLACCGALLTVLGFNNGLLGLIFGLPLALFLPGYALTTALLPASAQEYPARLTYSLGLSFALAIALGMLLNLTPNGLQPVPWALILAGSTILLGIVALVRRLRESERAALAPTIRLQLSPVHGLLLAAALVVLVGGYSLTRNAAVNQPYAGFTQAWLLPCASAEAGCLRVGVRNLEHEAVQYRAELRVGGAQASDWPTIELEPGVGGDWTVQLTAEQLAAEEAELLVYRLDQPDQIYRHATLWLRQ